MFYLIEDFERPMVEYNRLIKGFGGTTIYNVHKGTIVWRWMDDDGQVRKFTIPNLYYVPDIGIRLLSPQHWGKTQYKRETWN